MKGKELFKEVKKNPRFKLDNKLDPSGTRSDGTTSKEYTVDQLMKVLGKPITLKGDPTYGDSFYEWRFNVDNNPKEIITVYDYHAFDYGKGNKEDYKNSKKKKIVWNIGSKNTFETFDFIEWLEDNIK